MADEKTALHEWLQQRSSGQISQSLESYLVRPIQRVLKYPLLLAQMRALCAKGTTNYNKLEEALRELEKGRYLVRCEFEFVTVATFSRRPHQRDAAHPGRVWCYL